MVFFIFSVTACLNLGGHSAALEIMGDKVTALYPGGKRKSY